jgi:molybdopterin molybdotransferase
MMSVTQAQEIVLKHARPLPPVMTPLAPAALGRVLAEDVVSDLDMPPYDKSLMDGYAVRAADLSDGCATLTILEEITAGRTPTRPVGPGEATRIMTGAPIPSGADAVVIVERTQLRGGRSVAVEDQAVRPGQNILLQGCEMRRGETVVAAGSVLRPQEFGVLATVGRTMVMAHPAPVVALMTSGDEIVEADQQPGPGQIRNGNSPMLAAQIARAGGVPRYLGIALDERASLRALIAQGLRSPMLVLSGGVSAGVADLVPEVLRELGVEAHFHKVAMKPGKPVFFGVHSTQNAVHSTESKEVEKLGSPPATLVFGLPGNPVSSLVCFELFVRPTIRCLRGHSDPGPMIVRATLTEEYAYKTDRPTYHPAWLEAADSGWSVRAVPWFGSSDLRGLTPANAFILFQPGDERHQAGSIYPVLRVEY